MELLEQLKLAEMRNLDKVMQNIIVFDLLPHEQLQMEIIYDILPIGIFYYDSATTVTKPQT